MLIEFSRNGKNVTGTGEFVPPHAAAGQQTAELVRLPGSGNHDSAWSRFKNTKIYRRAILPVSVFLGGATILAGVAACSSSSRSGITAETALTTTLRPAAVSIAEEAIALHKEYPAQVTEHLFDGSKTLVQISGTSDSKPNSANGSGTIDAVMPLDGGPDAARVVYASAQFDNTGDGERDVLAIKGTGGAAAAAADGLFATYDGGGDTPGWAAVESGGINLPGSNPSDLFNTTYLPDFVNQNSQATPTEQSTATQIAQDLTTTLPLTADAFDTAA